MYRNKFKPNTILNHFTTSRFQYLTYRKLFLRSTAHPENHVFVAFVLRLLSEINVGILWSAPRTETRLGGSKDRILFRPRARLAQNRTTAWCGRCLGRERNRRDSFWQGPLSNLQLYFHYFWWIRKRFQKRKFM